MAYVDYSSHWVLDTFLTYLEANQLGANCEHLYDTIAVEHNINTSNVDGTHKANSILGSYVNTTPISTGSQAIAFGVTWTPTVGVYQMINIFSSIPDGVVKLELYISGAWRTPMASTGQFGIHGIMFFDGTNMRLYNTDTEDSNTVWYQKF